MTVDGTQPPRGLPPGQRARDVLPIKHYGKVPTRADQAWTIWIGGDTRDGGEATIPLADLLAMPHLEVTADLHCAEGWSVMDVHWGGISASQLLELIPPSPQVTHVLVHAEYGFSATVAVEDLREAQTILATRLDDAPLPRERGGPVRLVVPSRYAFKSVKWVRGLEYHTTVERGFWESRGYHLRADPWREERYAHQE